MKRFLRRVALFLLPVVMLFMIVVGVYVYLDPFKVVRSYKHFIDPAAPGRVYLNRDYVSTTLFNRNAQQFRYDSYIFGNSRSIFYRIADWKPHLPDSSACFHFDASGETLFGIAKKVEYIDAHGLPLTNVLMILDYNTLLEDKSSSDHLLIISPPLVHNRNIVAFHWSFFYAFLNTKFLKAYIDFTLSGKVKDYMKNSYLIDDRPYSLDEETNEVNFDRFERMIENGQYYTPQRLAVFYPRDTQQKIAPPAIGASQRKLLATITKLFARHHTQCRIVINPLYDQVAMNAADVAYLKETFGSSNVFDYSGINRFTADYHNYYEESHYRSPVAAQILKEAYSQ